MDEAKLAFEVQVCFARPEKQWLRSTQVMPGTTLEQAILQSGILDEAEEIDLQHCRVGVYGKLKTLDTVLRERDRIEIYRPLQADPKEARRKRAAKRE